MKEIFSWNEIKWGILIAGSVFGLTNFPQKGALVGKISPIRSRAKWAGTCVIT